MFDRRGLFCWITLPLVIRSAESSSWRQWRMAVVWLSLSRTQNFYSRYHVKKFMYIFSIFRRLNLLSRSYPICVFSHSIHNPKLFIKVFINQLSNEYLLKNVVSKLQWCVHTNWMTPINRALWKIMCALIIAYMRVHSLNNKYPMLIFELILQFNRFQLCDLNINHKFYIQNICRMLI